MGRERELLCADRFAEYLKRVAGVQSVQRADGDEPPDFYMAIDSERFAVEVTDTKIVLPTLLNDGPVLEGSFINSHRNLTKRIEDEAQNQGILSGLYLLTFHDPATARRSAELQRRLKSEVLQYIRQTQHETACEEFRFGLAGKPFMTAQKYPGEQGVEACFISGAWEESDEVRQEIDDQLRDAVCRKRDKFLAKNITLPGILLLYRTYPFGSVEIFRGCISAIAEAQFFHSIFLAQDPGLGTGLMLQTRELAWS